MAIRRAPMQSGASPSYTICGMC